MKRKKWPFLRFYLRTMARYMPGLSIAPFIGTYRYFMSVQERMDADFAAFKEEERKARQDLGSSGQAVG